MQTNMSELQRAGIALCDAAAGLQNATAFTAIALCKALDTAFVASVGGKSIPFALAEYAFKPVSGGKVDRKLRNAQFAAIMSQGFGETDEVPDAVKAGFNRAFPAALYMAHSGGAAIADTVEEIGDNVITLCNGDLHNVPLAIAFECFDREGKLNDNGKTMVERVTAMYSPERGPEMSEVEATDMLWTKTATVNNATNRRYGLKSTTVTKALEAMGKHAVALGLIEPKTPRAPRPAMDTPSVAIAAFDTFLTNVIGTGDEAGVALNNEGLAALKALKAKLEKAIKAVA